MEKSPARLKVPDVEVRLPALMVSPFRVAALLPRSNVPAPGDLLVTGTPGGVGFVRTPKWFMKDGDIAEVEVEGVGVLKSPIKDEAPCRS